MSFDQEMTEFFRNYSHSDRSIATGYPGYAEAAAAQDVIRAQEIAIEALHGAGRTKAHARKDAKDKRIDRLFAGF